MPRYAAAEFMEAVGAGIALADEHEDDHEGPVRQLLELAGFDADLALEAGEQLARGQINTLDIEDEDLNHRIHLRMIHLYVQGLLWGEWLGRTYGATSEE